MKVGFVVWTDVESDAIAEKLHEVAAAVVRIHGVEMVEGRTREAIDGALKHRHGSRTIEDGERDD